MDSNRQVCLQRSGRLLIDRQPAADLKRLNEVVEQATRSLKLSQSYATPAPKITDCFCVFDIEREQCHMIYVHRVDYRPRLSPNVGRVVKFSKQRYAPCRAEKLRLATPSYYRDQETLPQGIADPDENTLRRNATAWARNRFSSDGVKMEAVFSSFSEPWIYSASHLSSYRASRDLKATFSDEYDYDAATEIKDVDAFAMWLGIDFALQIDKGKHLKLGGLNTWAYRASSYSTNLWSQEGTQNIDTFVHVCHGPVHYEDESSVIATDDDWVDIHGAARAWFTKRTEFADQSEYRFALSPLGTPEDKELWLDVSEDLRKLTSPMR